jgi:uncharacterized protein
MPLMSLEEGIGLSLMYTISMCMTLAAGFSIRGNWKLEHGQLPLAAIFISVVTILSLQFVLEPLQSLVPPSEMVLKILKGLQSQPVAFFFLVVVAAPVLEEILFRGIILDGYLKNYNPVNGILISSLLFGLIHGNLAQGIGAFLLGLLFGWIYWKTKSIAACIFLHAINNLLAFVSVVYSTEEDMDRTMRMWINNDGLYWSFYAISIALAVGTVWFVQGHYFRNTNNIEGEMDPHKGAA